MTPQTESLRELSPEGLPIGKEVLDTFYSACGYTPSHEISKLLNTKENIFPALE
jgi:hypothetical protein